MIPCWQCGQPAPDDDDVAFSGLCDECCLDEVDFDELVESPKEEIVKLDNGKGK